MGKGDKKTKKGKIIMGSYGVSRSQRPKKVVMTKKAVEKTTKKTEKAEVKAAEVEVTEVVAGTETADAKPKKAKKVVEGTPEEKKKAPKKEAEEGDAKPKAKKATTKKEDEDAPQQDLFTEEK